MSLNDVNNDVLSLLLILLIVVTVNNSRNRYRLTSSALVHPSLSAWIQLLRNADPSLSVLTQLLIEVSSHIVIKSEESFTGGLLVSLGNYLPLFSSRRKDCFPALFPFAATVVIYVLFER